MITWSSSLKAIIGASLALVLSGCNTEFGNLSLLDASASSAQQSGVGGNAGLERAAMMNNRLTLVPPKGYCVDRSSLTRNFAVIAGCNALQGQGASSSASGMMTVALVNAPQSGRLEHMMDALVPDTSVALRRGSTDQLALVYLAGDTPPGSDTHHWRGLAQVGPFLMSVAAYGAKDTPLASSSGERVVQAMVSRTRSATQTRPATETSSD